MLLAFIVLLRNKHTLLTENGENLMSAQPRISAHSRGRKIYEAPRAVNQLNTVRLNYIPHRMVHSIILCFHNGRQYFISDPFIFFV